MARGMRRTVIMSHGRDHDARGVKGTFRAGTAPSPEVLDAIPDNLGAVGNLPEQVRPGDPASTVARDAKEITGNRRTAMRMDEGVPVLPGGNRDATSSMVRPSESAVTPDKAPQVPAEEVVEEDEAEATEAEAPEKAAPAAATESEDDEVDEESSDSEDELALSSPLPTSKRSLIRAKVDDLRAWCAALEIVPEEYAERDDLVTGNLMRALIGDKLGIDHGIELPDEE